MLLFNFNILLDVNLMYAIYFILFYQ